MSEHAPCPPAPAMTRCAACDRQVWPEAGTLHIHLSDPTGRLAHLQGRCLWLCDDCWARLARIPDATFTPPEVEP